MSYNDLLVDIAESFSIWVVILALLSSYVSTLVMIHHISGYGLGQFSSNNNLPKLTNYKVLYKYSLFKNRL